MEKKGMTQSPRRSQALVSASLVLSFVCLALCLALSGMFYSKILTQDTKLSVQDTKLSVQDTKLSQLEDAVRRCPCAKESHVFVDDDVPKNREKRQTLNVSDSVMQTLFDQQIAALKTYCGNTTICVTDIDECRPNAGRGPCAQICTNTISNFYCSCNSGFNLANDGLGCEDIDECEMNYGRGPCYYYCENTIGSFICRCFQGDRLMEDGVDCEK